MNYKQFPKRELIHPDNWYKLAQMDSEQIQEIYDEWIQIDNENKEVYKQNKIQENIELEEINAVLSKYKISTKKYSKSNFLKCIGYHSWYEKNIKNVISSRYPYYSSGVPCIQPKTVVKDDIELTINCSPTNFVDGYKKLVFQYKQQLNKKSSNSKLLIESIKYATEHNIDISDAPDAKTIIAWVNEEAEQNYIKENYPNGTELYLKHGCDECSTWTIGDHRCSCGNRRVSLSIEGNLIDGYDVYPECY